ncbi:hypothetical protein GQR58_021206 [Nymphon striatum]|nr:hypothetical protein GQR58_021206 [Nymphon striatum]
MKSRISFGVLLFFVVVQFSAAAENKDVLGLWSVDQEPLHQSIIAEKKDSYSKQYHDGLSLTLDSNKMRAILEDETASKSSKSGSQRSISIPLPDGSIVSLNLISDNVLSEKLAEKFPNIRTFKVVANEQVFSGKVDITPSGFHAMLQMLDGEIVFIDPVDVVTDKYVSYLKSSQKQNADRSFSCGVKALGKHPLEKFYEKRSLSHAASRVVAERTTESLLHYRIAIATTGEYAEKHGGTVSGVMSAITTTLSRVNQILERDLGIHLDLVENNDLIINTDANSDPFTKTDMLELLAQNQEYIDSAQGISGTSNPINDSFDLDFVAHEIGHQLGATHTFNSSQGLCSGNTRSEKTAFEPGSGSSIMSYAGYCGLDNLQSNADAMYHIGSIEQISDFTSNGRGNLCGTQRSVDNKPPTVNAGNDYTIPSRTPFELKGTAQDVDGDTLIYAWEQIDAGESSLEYKDKGDNALFRVHLPSNNRVRTFPPLNDILTDSSSRGEKLPEHERALNFSFVAQDGINVAQSDEMVVNVARTGSRFALNLPKSQYTIGESYQVFWNVANTDKSPVNCTNVDLFLSSNGGANFSTTIAENLPNTGDAWIVIPTSAAKSTEGRFKITCSDNVFFAVSQRNFVITDRTNQVTYKFSDEDQPEANLKDTDLTAVATSNDVATASSNSNNVTSQSSGGGFTSVFASPWKDSDFISESVTRAEQSVSAKPTQKPLAYRSLELDEFVWKDLLKKKAASKGSNLDTDSTDIVDKLLLPLPDGSEVEVVATETSVLTTELAQQFPDIKTWKVVGVDSKISGRIDFTALGFHGMLMMPNGDTVFIEPDDNKNNERQTSSSARYLSFSKHANHDHFGKDFQCGQADLITYRLAVATTGEYTQYHGGSRTAGLSAVTTTINRVNEIYERDLSVTFQLVPQQLDLIYTDPVSDPYSNNDVNALIEQNIVNLNNTNVLGSSNYDIGHVFGSGNVGGLAFVGSTCNSSFKAGGATGATNPIGDGFSLDYVAHEIGHQMGAQHTFNSLCGERGVGTAVEPGSGSTIMSYAGLCGANNLQNEVDAQFHIVSILEMDNFSRQGDGASCGSSTTVVNENPIVSAGEDFVVPARTPVGDASDVDVDTGNNALFRSRALSESNLRFIPQLSDIFNGEAAAGEHLPVTNRDMELRATVRDGKGGVENDAVIMTVHDTGSAFEVTSHTSTNTYGQGDQTTVRWNVAGTSSSPISCQSVDIGLITLEGTGIDITTTSNDGSEEVTIPANAPALDNARFIVSCATSQFFSISSANLRILDSLGSGDVDTDTDSGISILMQACVAVPNESSSNKSSSQPSNRFSIENIKKQKEAEYAKKYADLKKMNPSVEVAKAVKNNSIYLLAYQSGRGGARLIPGLVEPQPTTVKCRVLQLDGMGDSIYGENHLKYRVALRKYASAFAQSQESSVWQHYSENPQSQIQSLSDKSSPQLASKSSLNKHSLLLDEDQLKNILSNQANQSFKLEKGTDPSNSVEIELPLPDDIKTWKVVGVDDSAITGRIDFTSKGFHAMLVMADGDTIYIDPDPEKTGNVYNTLSKSENKDHFHTDFNCQVHDHHAVGKFQKYKNLSKKILANSPALDLKTYRFAVAGTAEYTASQGGTTASAYASMVTTVNRVNQIYQTDLGIKLELVSGEQMIYTNSATDPYTNNNASSLVTENMSNMTSTLGLSNFDLGHVFAQGPLGGLAYVGVACIDSANTTSG